MILPIKSGVKLMIFVALFSCLWACSSKDLSREKADAILRENFKDVLITDCSVKTLNSLLSLSKKPEFVASMVGQFCEKKLVVVGIHKTSETEAVVEFKAVSKANPLVLKKWLEAMDKLQSRLLALPRIGTTAFCSPKYQDPVDGQTFSNCIGVISTIRDTIEWENLQKAKQYCSNLLEKGQLESEVSTRKFRLYDDGWRVVG